MTKNNAKAFGSALGGFIHTIEEVKMEEEKKGLNGVKLVQLPKIYTVKHIEVHTVEAKKIQGGVDAIIVNGGQGSGFTVGANEKSFVEDGITELPENFLLDKKRTFFGDASTPTELTEALNMSAVSTIDEAIDQLTEKRKMIMDIVEANKRAIPAYDED